MKRLLSVLALVFITLSSFNIPSCEKECNPPNITVTANIFEASAVITFTGEQGQGVFVLDEEHDSAVMPNTGTYQICASFSGGCGGLRVRKYTSSGSENLLLVMPQGGTECVSGQTLVEQYSAEMNCE